MKINFFPRLLRKDLFSSLPDVGRKFLDVATARIPLRFMKPANSVITSIHGQRIYISRGEQSRRYNLYRAMFTTIKIARKTEVS